VPIPTPDLDLDLDLWQRIELCARTTPDSVLAIDHAGNQLTATTLARRAERCAAGFVALGVSPGSVVSWQLPNRLDSFVVTAALCRLGAVQNPMVPILRTREVSFICRQVRTSLIVVPSTWRQFDYAAMAEHVAGDLGCDVFVTDDGLPDGDPATLPPATAAGERCRWLFYTSGTTADPKGARHTDRSIIAAAEGAVRAVRLSPADRMAFIAPITHIGGIILLTSALLTGCTQLVLETFEIAETVAFFRNAGVTLVGMGTPMFTAYLVYQRAHPELRPLFPEARAFLSGGAPTPPALHHQLKAELGTVGVISGWGLTESPMMTWNTPDDADDDLANTEGRASYGARVVAVAPDGTLAEPGHEGELRVSGPQMMLGYVDAELDAAAFDSAGLFRTGDLGTVDERGFVRITGRLKDIIIRNMENISALEIEQLLFSHPQVGEVAIIGVPDERTGERVAAVVVPSGDRPPSLGQLADHLRGLGVSERKFPERIAYLDALPRNAMGKVVKSELRTLFAAGIDV
jgi:acyl-CoA synthetase (AMP-forming)/AMP-acid ligase II